LTWGPHEKQLQALADNGAEIQALKDRPVLDLIEKYYYSLYSYLANSRSFGLGFSPIPMSEYLALFQVFTINSAEERERIIFYCTQLDEEFFQWSQKQNGKRNSQNNPAANNIINLKKQGL